MASLKKDPEVVALIEAAVAKAIAATRRAAAADLKAASAAFLAAETRAKEFVAAHKGFVKDFVDSLKSN